MTSLKDKAKAGLIWSAIERFSTQFIQLAVMLVLARLLGPEAFGLIGMLAVFIALSQTVVDSGMREALIRTVTPTAEDCATVFYFNIGDRKSTRLNSSHVRISYAVFCLKKKKPNTTQPN